ncbi:unnamed protein product [Cylindrotheca closterium]|uniref:Uncharacterized protein n=1 Tax=Cylindrotheca closterium TaxID=2856 RepID=A0AAD2G3W0_9STRA|nr:unnamed protein product [Cylindrotheca closterium]
MALIVLVCLLVGLQYFYPQLVTVVRTLLVNLVANFLADVLEHPRVQAAAASSIVAGMNATTDQPDLPERAATIYLKLQEQNEHVSRQLGEQFPKVAGAFLAGAAAGLRKKEPQKEEQSKNKVADNEPNKPGSRHWGSLFQGLKLEEAKTTTNEMDYELDGNATVSPLVPVGGVGSFHSCSDAVVEPDKKD